MKTQSILEVKNGNTLGAVREFLKTLLAQGIVDQELVPLEVPSADQVTPTIVSEPKQLDMANPLAPVMRINAAVTIARMQREDGTTHLGAVLRSCELRAVIELAKVNRVDLSRLMLIGVDCMGTYEPAVYAQIARASAEFPTDEMMHWTRQGPIAPFRLRNACQICEHFTPENAGLTIHLIGMNVREHLLVEMPGALAEKLHLPAGSADGRQKAIERLAVIRHHRREEALTSARQLLSDIPSLVGLVVPCTACTACLDVCPFWDTDAFMPRSMKELHTDWRPNLPSGEGIMVHEHEIGPFSELIALGRRAVSCVGCGMCESMCPRHVPLTAIHGVLGRQVQEEFHYVPGRSVNERLPWATLKE